MLRKLMLLRPTFDVGLDRSPSQRGEVRRAQHTLPSYIAEENADFTLNASGSSLDLPYRFGGGPISRRAGRRTLASR